jgi:hypothetical protein
MVLVLVRGLGGSDHPPRAPQRLVERRAVAEASLDDRRGDLRRQAFGELQLRREPGRHLRLRGRGIDAGNCRWAHSGGSFGVKHAVFPYIVLLALAARKAGRPIKWVESRLEHLVAATSATNRLTTLSAAVDKGGMVTALALGSAGGLWRLSAIHFPSVHSARAHARTHSSASKWTGRARRETQDSRP